MGRIGGPPIAEDEDGFWEAVARVGKWITQRIAAVLILAIFVAMAYLVYLGRIPGDALVLFAGVILGYLLHAVQDVF